MNLIYYKEIFSSQKKIAIDNDNIDDIEDMLKTTQPDEITDIADAKIYLEILENFREYVEKVTTKNGKNFANTLRNMLSVGEDGVYSNKLRFILELIQNVDDCDYSDESKRELDIKFGVSDGTIVLTYNEDGFKPQNVFAITGIAESGKNISPEKLEIGEKGIGFKSVFGVAEKVTIQSGYFSFELHRNHFTVPIPCYDNFIPVKGTKLTLYVGHNLVESLYSQIATEYCNEEVLLNKNPLLFLNKLTSLKFYIDGFRSLIFNVTRIETNQDSEFKIEENVKISVDLKDSHSNRGTKNINKEVICYRYTAPILYNRKMCSERYGEDTPFENKKMSLHAIIPYMSSTNNISKGSLYSFLPTQLKFSMPFVCHVPFKLDGSREFVDPQNNNSWFLHSSSELSNFISKVYKDLAHRVKNEIIHYLPDKNSYYFVNDSEKAKCLLQEQLKATALLNSPIFNTIDNNYKPINEVITFDYTGDIFTLEKIYSLFELKEELFIPPAEISLKKYGFKVFSNVYDEVFNVALKVPKHTRLALEILNEIDDFDYGKIIENTDSLTFSLAQVKEFRKYKKLIKAFNLHATEKLKNKMRPSYKVNYDTSKTVDIENLDPDDPIDISDLDEISSRYLSLINSKALLIASNNEKFNFIANNILILSEKSPIKSFAHFCSSLDKNDLFAANLTIKQASRELNDADNSLDASEYLRMLRGVRGTIQKALGKKAYQNYIKIINDSGSDANRFINELLQNADDCRYERLSDKDTPTFSLEIIDNKLITSYNEDGFTNENVRSITAIGESTKKQISCMSDGDNFEIGEKGVGFKSVFAAAKTVHIHSNDFHFELNDETPTIPNVIPSLNSKITGTRMEFNMKNRLDSNFFSEEKVLSLCLCLRTLKKIKLGTFDIQIIDDGSERVIIIGNSKYSYKVIRYKFEVSDEEALNERTSNQRNISKSQFISCYVPIDNKSKVYYLYNGLPTKTESRIPLIIDAPFELTTSRDETLESKWNTIIKDEIYNAIISVIIQMRETMKIDVLSFVSLSYSGNQYNLNMFSDKKLNNSDFIEKLSNLKIIATLGSNAYSTPSNSNIVRIPNILHTLIEKGEDVDIPLETIIANKGQSRYDSILNYFKVPKLDTSEFIDKIEMLIPSHIENKNFREELYAYLIAVSEKESYYLKNRIKKLPIIPIKGLSDDLTLYVPWQDNKIFVKDDSGVSTNDYYFLQTDLLSRSDCEKILGVHINIMDEIYAQSMYIDAFKSKVSKFNDIELYNYIIGEFQNNHSMFLSCEDTIVSEFQKKRLPFKLENGKIRRGKFFTSKMEPHYFNGSIVSSLLVDKECNPLLKLIDLTNIENSNYDDFRIENNLESEDIEDFQDINFKYGVEILKGCVNDDLISDELMEIYNLRGLDNTEIDEDYDFPNQPLKSISGLKAHIRKIGLSKIVDETVEINKLFVEFPNGIKTSLDVEKTNARNDIIQRYTPDENRYVCFCQMCKSVKPHKFIEVNSIELSPKYYWSQMRLSLCLECSKTFSDLRKNNDFRSKFINELKSIDFNSDEPIDVKIGTEIITFNQTHLAEIQEILKTISECY